MMSVEAQGSADAMTRHAARRWSVSDCPRRLAAALGAAGASTGVATGDPWSQPKGILRCSALHCNGRRAPHVLSIAMGASLHHCQLISPARLFTLDTLNEALQTRMQCAGSTLAERRAGNAGFL